MPDYLKRLISKIKGDRFLFVFISSLVNILVLLRGYLFMKILDHAQLGVIVIFQSVILLISSLHFGILNGGYRMLCIADNDSRKKLINFFYTFTLLLIGLGLLFTVVFTATHSSYSMSILLAGLFSGILAIIRTWISNHMLAESDLRKLNIYNFISTVLSLLVLIWHKANPVWICMASVAIQSLLFILFILLADKRYVPSKLYFSYELSKTIMKNGFIIFLTGLFLQLNAQVERYFILDFLGVEELGHFYLAIIFLNLFVLIPTSLDSMYLPQALKLYKEENYILIRMKLIQFFKVLLLYCIAGAGLTLLLAKPLLSIFLPDYISDLEYVYLVLPGIIIFTLSNPFAIIFNLVAEYGYYLKSYLAGFILTFLLLGGFYFLNINFSLTMLCLVKDVIYLIMSVILMAGYIVLTNKNKQLRIFNFSRL